MRARLKIFFGASPGVGKTYAMLESARRLKANGVDVVVGVVETHGRAEPGLGPMQTRIRSRVGHNAPIRCSRR